MDVSSRLREPTGAADLLPVIPVVGGQQNVTRSLDLDANERILVVCPHPDDESLATGGLLARASALGAPLRIAYFTSGDNNPWAQRATERRLRIRATDRERFGRLRREEVVAALEALGLPQAAGTFFPFPDQGLTRLLLAGGEALCAAIADEIEAWRPTLLVGPSLLDRHPDHSAVAALLCLLLERLPPSRRPARVLRYLIHNPTHDSPRAGELTLRLTPAEQHAKGAAIACHRSQSFWRGGWLASFATSHEHYLADEPETELLAHPIRGIWARGDRHSFEVASGNHWRAFGQRTICLIADSPDAGPIRLAVPLPALGGQTPVLDTVADRVRGQAQFEGAHGRGTLVLPASLLAGSPLFLAKVEHRFGFFDEAGWKPLLVSTIESGALDHG